MNEKELEIQKKLTIYGIYGSLGMAAGVGLISIGIAILFSILPFIAQFEHSQFTTFDQSVIDSETRAYQIFVGLGSALILITVGLSKLAISKIKVESNT